MIAKTSIVHDTRRAKNDNTYPVKLRVTFNRKQKYYLTNINLNIEEFKDITTGKRLTTTEKNTKRKIDEFENKAIKIIQDLPIFTFIKFEEMYFENRDATDSIAFAFDKYIDELKEEKRIGTAVSYECAKASINKFNAGLKFADVTPTLLKKYENWMLQNGNSVTTIGIYLRSLRTIFNRADVDKALYPFGEKKGKYSIPTGRNIKKALNLTEIAKIYHYAAPPDTTESMAKDYWLFLYLCNGMNVKDFCLLKRSNIDGNILTFHREKTKRSKRESLPTVVSLKPEAKAVINKWGLPSISPESYIFPHIKKGMTATEERQAVQQLTKTINKYMKRIAEQLEINKPVTTYFARHSFATVLKNSGASIEFISEALAHSSQQTTKSYLSGFEQDAIHKTTDALLNFAQ